MKKLSKDEMEKRRLLAEAAKRGRVIKCAPGYPTDWTPKWAEGLGPLGWGELNWEMELRAMPRDHNNSSKTERPGTVLPCRARAKKWPVRRSPS